MTASFVGGAIVLLAVAAASSDAKSSRGATKTDKVVFVCAHGNVKSLIASSWFNRLASERGLAIRAEARGLTPENPVPPAIADRLRREDIDVSGYEARALAPADVDGSTRLVLIGVEPPGWLERRRLKVDTWDGIPPASERYEEARDAMRARIEALLDDLKARGR